MMNCTKKLETVLGRIQDIVGKGNDAANQRVYLLRRSLFKEKDHGRTYRRMDRHTNT